MKKVFMPTMDELYQMQDKGADIKLYLYAKAIEALCIEYNNYYNKDSILKYEFNYIKENEMISHAICQMYPKEIENSKVAEYDVNLAQKILNKSINNDIYRLDNLSRFSDCVIDNTIITSEVINILSKELKNNPKYRFEYIGNKLLEDIFMGRINVREMYPFYESYGIENKIQKLAQIEPYYAMQSNNKYNKEYLLSSSVIDYINRYGFDFKQPIYSEVKENKDILTNQTKEVKRLFRCINRK